MLPLCWWTVLALNMLALLVYGFDKWRAGRGGRRVPEATLLWLLFLGGVVGAWVGMQWFRHKTQKMSFRWRAIALTVVNPLWLLVWWTIDTLGRA